MVEKDLYVLTVPSDLMAIMPYPTKPPAKPEDKNKVSRPFYFTLPHLLSLSSLSALLTGNSPNLQGSTRNQAVSQHGPDGCHPWLPSQVCLAPRLDLCPSLLVRHPCHLFQVPSLVLLLLPQL